MKDVVKEKFSQHFSQAPEIVAYAPGRVNLIGEHTDYNNGFVFPCAIQFGTYIAARKRDDKMISVYAGNINDQHVTWSLEQPLEATDDAVWSNYCKGICKELLESGHELVGMDLFIIGNLPSGAGLSSSASLCVAFALVCNTLNQLGLDAIQMAQVAQKSENDFVGCNCGIMDQIASAAGIAGKALLLDCESLSYRPVGIPDDLDVLIIDSCVKRELTGSEYNDRRADCERAAGLLGLSSLRQADISHLDVLEKSGDKLAYMRARHVITENERTQSAAKALESSDAAQLSALMNESHQSMKNDFQITIPEIDFLVESVAQHLNNDGGVRMTGGGFGGCVVALTPKAKSQSIMQAVADAYAKEYGKECKQYLVGASAGAHILESTLS